MGGSHSASLEQAAAAEIVHTGMRSGQRVAGAGNSASEQDEDFGVHLVRSFRDTVVLASVPPVDGIAWYLGQHNCSSQEMILLMLADSSSQAAGRWVYSRETLVAGAYFRSAKAQLAAFEEKGALGIEAWNACGQSTWC